MPDTAYFENAARKIDTCDGRLENLSDDYGEELKLSVSAIAPMPLLMYLGSKLSDKSQVDLFQRQRDPETWTWHGGAGTVRYRTERCRYIRG